MWHEILGCFIDGNGLGAGRVGGVIRWEIDERLDPAGEGGAVRGEEWRVAFDVQVERLGDVGYSNE